MNLNFLDFLKKNISSSSTFKDIQPELYRINKWGEIEPLSNFRRQLQLIISVTNDKMGVFHKGKKWNLALSQSKAIR